MLCQGKEIATYNVKEVKYTLNFSQKPKTKIITQSKEPLTHPPLTDHTQPCYVLTPIVFSKSFMCSH